MYPKTQNRVHIEEKEMRTKQLSFDFGVTPEQSCIMCHLASECSGCCNKCIAEADLAVTVCKVVADQTQHLSKIVGIIGYILLPLHYPN